jgi:hypothetical protein
VETTHQIASKAKMAMIIVRKKLTRENRMKD